MDQSSLASFDGDATDLRAMLEQVRRDAELEIARLNRKLTEREYAIEPNATSATERQAMQQDLLTLQNALRQKERTLDHITEECRRLEDALEDQHVAFDGLKQEVERKDTSLRAAREEVQRLRHQMASLQDQSQSIAGYEGTPPTSAPPQSAAPTQPDQPSSRSQRLFKTSIGLISGLALIGLAALFVRSGIHLELPTLPREAADRPATEEAATASPKPIKETSSIPEEPPLAIAPAIPVPSAGAPEGPAPAPPPTVRDRLRDGSLGPTLAVLPGGSFRMGFNSLSGGDTGPEHSVRVAPFLIGIYEVTFTQYYRFVSATGRPLPTDFGWGRGDRPVVGVSWSDAVIYTTWLTRQTGKRYRLPSEAEWEYAARAGSRGSYWWGFGMEPGRAVCFDCSTEWDNRYTAPVGSYPPSPFGLYDTAGNAMEWVLDCYAPSYEGAPADGRPRTDGDCSYRVARGGAFNKPSASMRVYARAKLNPGTRLDMVGFRVARDP